MKIMTVLGTRPEIIRLSKIIGKLDQICDHVLVHTGQNYDTNLNDIFFQEMNVRQPDHFLQIKGSFGKQAGSLFEKIEKLIKLEKPDKFLVLGDTNSALSVIMAKRLGVPVYHMEAGNRCFDDRVPEEVNRRIIDHSSDILMPYTERSRKNLLREGFAGEKIYVTGNPILEVIKSFQTKILTSTIFEKLELLKGKYFLVTLHRAENVDVEKRLRNFSEAFDKLQRQYEVPVIVSTHPRTLDKINSFGIEMNNDMLKFMPPFGFFDFLALEMNAYCVLSDSGTVQEECSIFKVPNVTLRDVTERPETMECGSNILSGSNPKLIEKCVDFVLSSSKNWEPPIEYMAENVSERVIKILLSYSPDQINH